MCFADHTNFVFYENATTEAASPVFVPGPPTYFFLASGKTNSGAGAAGCLIYGRDIETQPWVPLLDVTLTLGTSTVTETGTSMSVPVRYAMLYADLYNLTGTGAKFSLTMTGSP